MSRSPRSNLALENAHRSGGAANNPLVTVATIGDHLAEGAIAVNARRIITYANRIATGLLGIRAEALIGHDVLTLATQPESSVFARALTEVLERGVEQVITVKDADTAPAFNVDYYRLLPIADGGALILLGETMSPSVSEQLSKARSLAEILQRINQSLEVERVVQLLATHAATLLGAATARVLILDDGELQTAASSGTGTAASGTRQPLAESFAGRAVQSLRAARTDDLAAIPGCRDAEIPPAGTSTVRIAALTAPLQIGNRPIGAVLVTSFPERRFSDHDEQLLITLATHGAIAVENARLYRAAAQTARHAGVLAATARTLAYTVSPESLFAGLDRLATEALRADGFSIYAADSAHEHITLLRSQGLGATTPNVVADMFWSSRTADVLRSAVPEFLSDLGGAASPEPRPLLDVGKTTVGAIAILPLIIEGQARGLLTLRFRQPRVFEERERTLLVDFSAAVAVAVRNASLVGDLERRATRLSAVAKVQLAMSRTELQDVYVEIYRAVASSVSNASCFALLLADNVAPLFRPQLIAVDGIVTWSRALSVVPLTKCAASTALRTGRPVLSSDPDRSWAALVPGTGAAPLTLGARSTDGARRSLAGRADRPVAASRRVHDGRRRAALDHRPTGRRRDRQRPALRGAARRARDGRGSRAYRARGAVEHDGRGCRRRHSRDPRRCRADWRRGHWAARPRGRDRLRGGVRHAGVRARHARCRWRRSIAREVLPRPEGDARPRRPTMRSPAAASCCPWPPRAGCLGVLTASAAASNIAAAVGTRRASSARAIHRARHRRSAARRGQAAPA